MFKYLKSFSLVDKRNKGQVYIMLPPVLLVILVIALLVYTIAACTKFTKRSSSVKALENQLLRLQARLGQSSPIDADLERQQIEILQNKLKTSSDGSQISENLHLKDLSKANCLSINTVLKDADLANRTGWIKLNRVMLDFNDLYFK